MNQDHMEFWDTLLKILTAPIIAPYQIEKYTNSPSNSKSKHSQIIQRL